MWDEQSGFFYNLARDTGTFTTKAGIDLRRKEIIGFLPLWAGIATKEQAARLAQQAAGAKAAATPLGAAAANLYQMFVDGGGGALDFSGIMRFLSRRSNA